MSYLVALVAPPPKHTYPAKCPKYSPSIVCLGKPSNATGWQLSLRGTVRGGVVREVRSEEKRKGIIPRAGQGAMQIGRSPRRSLPAVRTLSRGVFPCHHGQTGV